MRKFGYLLKRNIKLYFKDKTLFFTSLITPLILIVLFLTFLGDIYKSTLLRELPSGLILSDSVINAFTGGWLFSSIVSVSCVTVAFCSNLMVADKISKTNLDFALTTVKKSTLNFSYTVANFLTTFIICGIAFAISMIYLAIVGFYLSLLDILMILAVMIISILIGCLLASIVGFFLSTQGGLSGVCTLVSSLYGFVSGAYMPISQFATGMQYVLSFNPGTYATVLLRQGYMNGVLNEMSGTLNNPTLITEIRKTFDGTFYFFGTEVSTLTMFVVTISTVIVLAGVYFLLSYKKSRATR